MLSEDKKSIQCCAAAPHLEKDTRNDTSPFLATNTNTNPYLVTNTNPYLITDTNPYLMTNTNTNPYLITNTNPYLVTNTNPYLVTNIDIVAKSVKISTNQFF